MRGFVCIIVLLLNSFALKAQEGSIYWITPSRQCFAEEVVFVRNLPLESKSLKAKITIASEHNSRFCQSAQRLYRRVRALSLLVFIDCQS